MSIEGYYYLHTNGDLIFKRGGSDQVADFRESDFVRMFWPFDSQSRYTVWRILAEANALGADKNRISDLSAKWQCDDEDAANFAECFGLNLFRDVDQWCATKADHIDIQSSPAGFGHTCLEAISELLKDCGFKASKMWGHTIKDLLQCAP